MLDHNPNEKQELTKNSEQSETDHRDGGLDEDLAYVVSQALTGWQPTLRLAIILAAATPAVILVLMIIMLLR